MAEDAVQRTVPCKCGQCGRTASDLRVVCECGHAMVVDPQRYAQVELLHHRRCHACGHVQPDFDWITYGCLRCGFAKPVPLARLQEQVAALNNQNRMLSIRAEDAAKLARQVLEAVEPWSRFVADVLAVADTMGMVDDSELPVWPAEVLDTFPDAARLTVGMIRGMAGVLPEPESGEGQVADREPEP